MTLLLDVFPSFSSFRPAPAKCPPKSSKLQAKPKRSSSISSVVNGFLFLRDGLTHEEREEKRLQEERRQIISARLQNAESYTLWHTAAHELDVLEGNEDWKADISTGDYHPDLLELRLRELDDARTGCDMHAMMHLVRTALSRDLGGMGNIDLYRHSYCGTKKLIERYVDSTLQTIKTLVDRSARHLPDDLDPKDLLEAMLYARQSFGRSALLLSGGGTFGMTHIGVLKAMFEAKLLPRIISGASAGSIVCSVICTRTDDEIPLVLQEFPHGDLAVFEEEGNEDGLLDHLRRLLTEGNWSDIKHLTRVMRELLGDMTFQEAYNRTRRICNICVSSASIYELPRLLNYVTAPNVMIWSAVAASCSVPLVFSAAPLLVKNPLTGEHSPWNPTPQMWIDGSVDNDLPMTRLAEMFNVNHFIVSQVNPHVVPFLAKDDAPCASPSVRHQSVYKEESDWLNTITTLAKGEALHRMQFMAEIGIFPTLVSKLRSILSQKYSGDINILPAMGVMDLPKILTNPTTEFMTRSCLLGERATWPKLSRIRDRCAIELALDQAVRDLRARVVFSKSQVDLRRMATGTLHRRSHEPLASTPVRAEGISTKEKFKHSHRRSSGSNLLHPYLHSLAHDPPCKLTDEDTDEEERLEMAMRHPRGKPKMKLKRFPKGHMLQSGPKSSPVLSSTTDTDAFDFSQPVSASIPLRESPPRRPAPQSTLSAVLATDADATDADGSESYRTIETASMTSPLQASHNGEVLETSDLHSSDADVESHMHSSDADVESHTDDDGAALAIKSSDVWKGEYQDVRWSHPLDGMEMDRPSSRDDMFSLSRRERDSQSSFGDVLDPGAGLWN